MGTSTIRAPLFSRLKRWRLNHAATLQDVSDLTGISVSMLSEVESGRRRFRPATKLRVAKRLGVPLRELFEPEDAIDDAEAMA